MKSASLSFKFYVTFLVGFSHIVTLSSRIASFSSSIRLQTLILSHLKDNRCLENTRKTCKSTDLQSFVSDKKIQAGRDKRKLLCFYLGWFKLSCDRGIVLAIATLLLIGFVWSALDKMKKKAAENGSS